MFKPSKSSLTHSLLAALFTVLPVQNAFSAPGTLPTAPLFLSTLVEPSQKSVVIQFAVAYFVMSLIMFFLGVWSKDGPIETDEEFEALSQ